MTTLNVALLALTLALETDARTEAGRAFQRGNAALAAKDYAAAVDAFSEAYRLFPVVQVLFNLALAYDKNQQLPEALATFRKFEREFPNAPPNVAKALAWQLPKVRKRIEELQKRLGETNIETVPSPVPAESPQSPEPGDSAPPATPGDAGAEADGTAPAPPDARPVTIVPPDLKPPRPSPSGPQVEARAHGASTSRWWWVALGVAAAAAAATFLVLSNRNACPNRGELGCIPVRD